MCRSVPFAMFSILIPTYNRFRYLCEAIESALAQTLPPREIVVLDDSSPDETPRVQELYGDRIRYIRHESNLGIVGNWLFGFHAARGPYTFVLHDDDVLEPTALAELGRVLRAAPSADLVFCNQSIIDEKGNLLPDRTADHNARYHRASLTEGFLPDLAQDALIRMSIPVGAAVYRSGLLKQVHIPAAAVGQADLWLFYELVKRDARAYFLPRPLVRYRVHPNSMSGGMQRYCLPGGIFRCRAILEDESLRRIHPAVRKQLAGYSRRLAHLELQDGDWRLARVHAFQAAMATRCMDWKALAMFVLSLAGPMVPKRLASRM